MNDVLCIILGGGRGTRLYPLTLMRSKPAVPLAGKYRLIDVPISNCINSGVNRILILTQFNSASLNNHVSETYHLSEFSRGFVNIIAAEQTPTSESWFQGTADAVRQSLTHIQSQRFRYALILSGDHLYRMDYLSLLAAHREKNAAITVATTAVTAAECPGFGIMRTDATGRIMRFVEKPPLDKLEGLESETGLLKSAGKNYLASMGIYVFNRETLLDLLNQEPKRDDFGRHIIPEAIDRLPVYSHRFDGYWADIGTIASYYESNLALTSSTPPINLFDGDNPIFTHPRQLCPSRLENCQVIQSMVAEGSILVGAKVERSLVGIRSIVGAGSVLKETIVTGGDFYESSDDRARNRHLNRPDVGIGKNCTIERAIIDKNARIGNNVTIRSAAGRPDEDGPNYFIRDGLVCIAKGAIVPDGTTI